MSKLNPQNATAYVGPGVLRKGGKITPVPNGPLVKKKGPFKGSTLKTGGRVIKKAQGGEYLTQEGNKYTSTKKVNTKDGPRYYQGISPSMSFARRLASEKALKINDSIPKAKLSPRAIEMTNQKNGGKVRKAQNGDSTKVSTTMTPYMQKRAAQQLVREANIRKRDSVLQRNANVAGITREELRKQQAKNDKKPDVSPSGDNAISLKDARQSDCKITSKKNCGIAKEANRQNKKQRFKNGGIMKKAQVGTKVVKGSRPGMGVFRTTKERTTNGGLFEPYKYKTESIDTTGYSKGRNSYKVKTVEGEGDKTGSKVTSSKSKIISRKNVPSTLKSLNKAKGGAMIKRADGSYSRRGLWDNIRANKGSGKKPTKQMLQQEKKIKAKSKK